MVDACWGTITWLPLQQAYNTPDVGRDADTDAGRHTGVEVRGMDGGFRTSRAARCELGVPSHADSNVNRCCERGALY